MPEVVSDFNGYSNTNKLNLQQQKQDPRKSFVDITANYNYKAVDAPTSAKIAGLPLVPSAELHSIPKVNILQPDHH